MRDVYGFVKEHKVATVIVTALVINVCACLLSAGFDSAYWAAVVRNIRSGSGLYSVDGYYYTPVWGYFLGISDALATSLVDLGNYLVVVPQAIGIKVDPFCFTAETTKPLFNLIVKTVLVAGNFILAYLVYCIIGELGYSKENAFRSAALVMLCPITIVGSCFIGMPDIYSAVFIAGTILMMIREKYFLAGVFFSVSVLTKFFPVFLIFILLAYIIAKYRDDCMACIRNVAKSIAGALIATLVIYAPVIKEGMFFESFRFLSDRAASMESMISSHTPLIICAMAAVAAVIALLIYIRNRKHTRFFNCMNLVLIGTAAAVAVITVLCITGGGIISGSRVAFYVFLIFMSMVSGIVLYRNREGDFNRRFIALCFIMMIFCMLYPPTPQYLVILVPFITLMIGMNNEKCMKGYAAVSVGVFLFVLIANGPLLMSLAQWTDLISVDTVMNIHHAFDLAIGGTTLHHILYLLIGIIQYCAILILLWFGLINNKEESGFPEMIGEIKSDRPAFLKRSD